MVCTRIDHRNDIRMFTTQVEPVRHSTSHRSMDSLQSFEHFDVISMVDKRLWALAACY